MVSSHYIDVSSLDASHKEAIEQLLGCRLNTHQRLVVSVEETIQPLTTPGSDPARQQSLKEWTSIYEGLNDIDLASLDEILNHRPQLYRDVE